MKKNQIECADMGNIITKIKSPKAAMRGDLGRGGLDGSGYLDSAEMRRWRHGGRVTDMVTEGDIPNALKGKPGGATRRDGGPTAAEVVLHHSRLPRGGHPEIQDPQPRRAHRCQQLVLAEQGLGTGHASL